MSGSRLKVLSIAHNAHGEGSGRLRYAALVDTGEVDLVLVVPDRWAETGVVKPADPNRSIVDIRPRPVRLPFNRWVKWYAHWYPKLGQLIREVRPDVLHLWEEPWSIVALQAAILRDRIAPEAALVLESDQNILYKLPPPFGWMRRYSLKQTDWLITRNEEVAKVNRDSGYTGGNTDVTYCVDSSVFCPCDAAAQERAESRGRRPLRLGYVGRVIAEKGLFTVLEALRSVDGVKFTVLGDGLARQELQDRIKAYGLTDRVELLPGRPAGEVAAFMRSLDALLLMSETTATWKEQFGRVIIEAQACGTPVIGSSSGAIPEVVGEGGWIVREKDAIALAALFTQLCSHPKLLQSAEGNALRNVKRFSSELIAQSFLTALHQAARRRSSSDRK